MALYPLDDTLWFPPVEEALPDGLLAVGGDLRPERVLAAYKRGIFPWFNDGQIPLWWSPDPRFVLFPDELRVSKSMKKVIKNNIFEFRNDTSFKHVIEYCSNINRREQDGTWITKDIILSYTRLHEMGFAHSAETWQNNELVGGLYGVRLGNIFFGESMFTKVDNASKFAFLQWVNLLKKKGVVLIDCQMFTKHLESLGARGISRCEFIKILNRHTGSY